MKRTRISHKANLISQFSTKRNCDQYVNTSKRSRDRIPLTYGLGGFDLHLIIVNCNEEIFYKESEGKIITITSIYIFFLQAFHVNSVKARTKLIY